MGQHFTSGLLAGVTAAVIWISIGLLVAMAPTTIGLWALIFLVVGCLATILIASAVARSVDRTA